MIRRQAKATKSRGSLVDFFRNSPLVGMALEVGRSRDCGRPVKIPDMQKSSTTARLRP